MSQVEPGFWIVDEPWVGGICGGRVLDAEHQ